MQNTIFFTLLLILLYGKSFCQTKTLSPSEALALSKDDKILTEVLTVQLKQNKFPEGFEVFKNLKTLNIIADRNFSLPKSLAKIDNLHDISISLPPVSVDDFITEKTDNLSDSAISVIRERAYHRLEEFKKSRKPLKVKFPKLPQVYSLRYSDCQLKKIPASVKNLEGLKVVSFSGNQLRKMPALITKLDSLKEVLLSKNNITLKSKREYAIIGKISSVYLAKNKIEYLNESVSLWKNVRFLNFGENSISRFHPNLFDLDSLEGIVFYKNKLSQLNIPCGKWQNLQDLDLYYNDIKALKSSGVGLFLPKLRALYFAYNNAESITEKIGECRELEELYLHHNKFTIFPTEFGNLKDLQVFQAHNNLLINFPDFLLDLKNIREITLYNNSISTLPPLSYLFGLSGIKKFFFANNLLNEDELTTKKFKELLEKWESNDVNFDF